MQAFDLTIPFEDVYPVLDFDACCTFRALVEAIDIDHWNITSIENRSQKTGEWLPVNRPGWREDYWSYATSDAGYEVIQNAIREAMHEQAELALNDVADHAYKIAAE